MLGLLRRTFGRSARGQWLNTARESGFVVRRRFGALPKPDSIGNEPAELFAFAQQEFEFTQLEPEIAGLLDQARLEGPRRVCELGTWRCGTTFLLARSLPTVRYLVGVDQYIQNTKRLRYYVPQHVHLTILAGDSSDPRTVERVSDAVGGEPLDILFVDADHTYTAVRDDFLAYRPLLREGSMVVFHDIVPDFRTRFGHIDGPWSGEVPQFWKRIRSRYTSTEFVQDWNQNALGIGVIKYQSDVPIDDL